MTNSTFFLIYHDISSNSHYPAELHVITPILYNEEATTPFLNYYISYLSLAINPYIVFYILTGTRYSAILSL